MSEIKHLVIVKICQNLTACDTFNEETFQGSTQRTISEHVFVDLVEATEFFNEKKTMTRFAGLAGQYVTHPVEIEIKESTSKRAVELDVLTEDKHWLTLKVDSKRIVCATCDGDGTHVNRAVDGNGITADEWNEICHDDPDFPQAYMSGLYDVRCETCHGEKVMDVPDLEALPEWMQNAHFDFLDDRARDRQQQRDEQRGMF